MEHLEHIENHNVKVPLFRKIISICILIGNGIFLLAFLLLYGKLILQGNFAQAISSSNLIGSFYLKLTISAIASVFSLVGGIYILQRKKNGQIICLFANLVWIIIQSNNYIVTREFVSIILLIITLVSSLLLFISKKEERTTPI